MDLLSPAYNQLPVLSYPALPFLSCGDFLINFWFTTAFVVSSTFCITLSYLIKWNLAFLRSIEYSCSLGTSFYLSCLVLITKNLFVSCLFLFSSNFVSSRVACNVVVSLWTLLLKTSDINCVLTHFLRPNFCYAFESTGFSIFF